MGKDIEGDNRGIYEVHRRLGKLEDKLDEVDKRVEGVEEQVDELKTLPTKVEDYIASIKNDTKTELEDIKSEVRDLKDRLSLELVKMGANGDYQREMIDKLMESVLEGNRLAKEREDNARKRTDELRRETRNNVFKIVGTLVGSGGLIYALIQAFIN